MLHMHHLNRKNSTSTYRVCNYKKESWFVSFLTMSERSPIIKCAFRNIWDKKSFLEFTTHQQVATSALPEPPKSSGRDSTFRDSLSSSRITSKTVSCSTLKRVKQKKLNPSLQPISSEQLFPADMMQIDLVGPFRSPIYNYTLSGIDVLWECLFAVPLTSEHAGSVARTLVSIFFQHSYIRTTLFWTWEQASWQNYNMNWLIYLKINYYTLLWNIHRPFEE